MILMAVLQRGSLVRRRCKSSRNATETGQAPMEGVLRQSLRLGVPPLIDVRRSTRNGQLTWNEREIPLFFGKVRCTVQAALTCYKAQVTCRRSSGNMIWSSRRRPPTKSCSARLEIKFRRRSSTRSTENMMLIKATAWMSERACASSRPQLRSPRGYNESRGDSAKAVPFGSSACSVLVARSMLLSGAYFVHGDHGLWRSLTAEPPGEEVMYATGQFRRRCMMLVSLSSVSGGSAISFDTKAVLQGRV